MKTLKVLSLALIATSLASGAVYAKGGSGGGMAGGSMFGGGMSNGGAVHAQPMQHRTQTRNQTREAEQGSQGQRNEWRYENQAQTPSGNVYRYENRDQFRNGNDLPSM